MSQDPVPTALQSKRLVLFLAANPTNTQPLRLDEEVRAIRQQLQRSVLKLDSCWAVRPLDMQQEILRLKPQIVHFSGHGIGEPLSTASDHRTLTPVGTNHLHDEEGLAFIKDATGQAVLVDTEALANLFKHFKNYVECVVLNGCYSEVQAEAIARHIPYVIGMKEAILDRAAIEFSNGFYNALAEGEAIESAFELGKSAIELAGMPDFRFPVLHQPESTNAPQGLADLNPVPFKPAKLKPKRRLIAGGILAALVSSAAVGLSPELQRNLGMRQLTCFEKAKQEGKLLVAIAPFQRDPSNQNTSSSIENEIENQLEKTKFSISSCQTNELVKTESEARKLGNNLEAAVVIWGSQLNPLTLKVKVTAVKIKTMTLFSLNVTGKDESDFNNQLIELPTLVNVMTGYALNEINKHNPDARNAFESTLKYAIARDIDLTNRNNREILSKGYFALGFSYMPDQTNCLEDKINCEKAIDSFESATKFNPDELSQDVYWTRGRLQISLKKYKAAIQTYTDLIRIYPNWEYILEARKLRANLFMKQKDFKQAVTDFRILCDKSPTDHELLHKLGQAQLQAVDQLPEAQRTYHRVKELLESDDPAMSEIVNDLKLLAQSHSELTPNIDSIINFLNKKDTK